MCVSSEDYDYVIREAIHKQNGGTGIIMIIFIASST